MSSVKKTPMMVQYDEIKANNPGFLLFYRMGDFYELFGDDALKAAGILGITLTQRRTSADKEGVPMCGVPFHAAEGYIAKLIKHGLKVALCEQTETPDEAKKRGGSKALVKREVVRLYTSGTLVEDNLLPNKQSALLVGIGHDGEQLSLGWVDASSGDMGVCHTNRDNLSSELTRLNPAELILEQNLYDSLADILMPWEDTITIPRKTLFDKNMAAERLKSATRTQALDGFGFTSDAQTTICGALVAYIEETQVGRVPTLKTPKVHHDQSFVYLDASTRANLELTQTLRGERKGSLLWALDSTVTAAGGRLLSQWLATPLQDKQAVEDRLSRVDVFYTNSDLRADVRESLTHMADLARALTRITLGRGGPRDMGSIQKTLGQLPALQKLLGHENIFRPLLQNLQGFDELTTTLTRALADELPLLARDGDFIKKGYCPDLDKHKDLAKNGMSLLQNLERQEAEATGISSLKIKYNKVWGYYFEVTKTHASKVPERYIHRQTTTNSQRFTTPELVDIERDLASASAKALAREQELFKELSQIISDSASELLNAASALAELDVLQSAAQIAQKYRYNRPTLTAGTSFIIRDGRHPVVERSTENFMPNNADLSDGKLWLLTGPNMAGKSTFLRQNALITLMAHCGFYVPATEATIGMVDRIFTRIGAADDLARGQSTFMVEMVETANILNNASDKSLVILDEIGRGTATFDGLSIAWACVEHLVTQTKCRGLFATHYHEMTVLEDKLPSLSNHHVAVQEWEDDFVFLHEVRPGASPRSYGIHVGRLAGLPTTVTERANRILKDLESNKKASDSALDSQQLALFNQQIKQSQPQEHKVERLPSRFEKEVEELALDNMTPREALDKLYELKDKLNTRKRKQQNHG